MMRGRGRGRVGLGDNHIPTFIAESKLAKVPKFHYSGMGWGLVMPNF